MYVGRVAALAVLLVQPLLALLRVGQGDHVAGQWIDPLRGELLLELRGFLLGEELLAGQMLRPLQTA